jgi:2Fe-2S ferredoxin
MPIVTFALADGERRSMEAPVGLSLLEVSWRHDVPIAGDCGGFCSCGTCHLVVADEDFLRVGPPHEDEEDVLDMVFELATTSRLGCQVIVTEAMNGIVLYLPEYLARFRRKNA